MMLSTHISDVVLTSVWTGRSRRSLNTARMAEIIDAERESANDNGPKPSHKRKRKINHKTIQSDEERLCITAQTKATQSNLDEEDNDFVGSSSESETEGNDSDCIEINNKEVNLSYAHFILCY